GGSASRERTFKTDISMTGDELAYDAQQTMDYLYDLFDIPDSLPEALRRYPDLVPVLVEVEPAILRQRLLARGREQGKDLEERLQRTLAPLPAISLERLVHIDNSGKLPAAVDALENVVRAALPVRGMAHTLQGTQGSAA
ncbi:MAG: hypothetical protein IKC62_06750, partial [Desulfovibrio sp.]|nr:hypothetical protein [Desulfovibrio sp.]